MEIDELIENIKYMEGVLGYVMVTDNGKILRINKVSEDDGAVVAFTSKVANKISSTFNINSVPKTIINKEDNTSVVVYSKENKNIGVFLNKNAPLSHIESEIMEYFRGQSHGDI